MWPIPGGPTASSPKGINPTKTDNWHLWTALNYQGQLEVRNDPAGGSYVWNFCPKTHDGFCRVYMNQVITVQAGVTYDFAIQYSLTGARANAVNTLHLYVETLPEKRLVFSPYTVALNTDGWATFKPSPWTAPALGHIICTLHWYVSRICRGAGRRLSLPQQILTRCVPRANDPNDATVLIKGVSMTPVECRNPASTKTCSLESEPAATTTSTTTTSTSTVELDPTTAFTTSDIQSTTTTSSELESSTSMTPASGYDGTQHNEPLLSHEAPSKLAEAWSW